MRFENLPPFANHLEPPARNFAVAIVSPEVAERLLTFKNHCRSNLSALTAISRHISPILAFWQADFHRGRGKHLCLLPHQREPFQPCMLCRFGLVACYSFRLFASSPAQEF